MIKVRATVSVVAAAGLASVALFGCSDNNSGTNSDPGKPYRAQVVVLSSVAPGSGETGFRVETKPLKFLDSLTQLDGAYLRLVQGGELTIKQIEGSIIQSDKFDGGGAPKLRYVVKDGVIVPRDYSTLMMLSAYYQYEQVFDNLKTIANISIDDFVAKSGKLRVMFEPNIRIESEGSTALVTLKLNAAYVSGQKQFVLFQRSAVEKVPLAANLQVLGHEFGHALFEQSFYQNTFKRCIAGSAADKSARQANRFFDGRLEQEFAIKGINEGFSDFLSYSLTGSADILRSSIDIGTKADERNFIKSNFTFRDLGREKPEEQVCSGSFYCIGTLFARSLYQTSAKLGLSASDVAGRGQMSAAVVDAMAKAQATLKTLPPDVFPAASESAAACVGEGKFSASYDGMVSGAFINSFVANMPGDWRASLCENFKANFGTDGFPTAARSVCP